MRNNYLHLFLLLAIHSLLQAASPDNPVVNNLCYNVNSATITVTITENANGDLGGTTACSYVLKCPTGFEFVIGSAGTNGTVGVTNTSVMFESPGYIGINYDDDGAQTGTLEISFQVKATAYGSGTITKSGGTSVNGINTSTDHATLNTAFTTAPTLTPASVSVCPYGGNYVTLTGSPGGGTYSGTSVTANYFNPQGLSAATYTQTYNVSQGGCMESVTSDITVNPKPTVTFTMSDATPCHGSQETLTGVGAVRFSFVEDDGTPAAIQVMGTDHDMQRYFYTTMNGYSYYAIGDYGAGTCADTSNIIAVTVNAYSGTAPSWSGPANFSEYQINDNVAKQLTASPANGVFSGPGVTNDQFVPSAANVGFNTLVYTTAADGNGCRASANRYVQVNNGYITRVVPTAVFDVNWCVNGIAETIARTAPANDTLNARFGVGNWTFTGYCVSALRLSLNSTTFTKISGTSYDLQESTEVAQPNKQKFDPKYLSTKIGTGLSYIYTMVTVAGTTRYALETSFYLQNPYVQVYYYETQPTCVTNTNQALYVYPNDATITNYYEDYIDTSTASPRFHPNLTGVGAVETTYNVIAEYTDVYGCTNKDTLGIRVIPQPAKPTIDPNSASIGWATQVQKYCLNDIRKYFVCPYEGSATTFNWFSNPTLTTVVASDYYYYPGQSTGTPGTTNYYVNKTINGCTSDTMRVTFIVNDRASVSAGPIQTFCSDGTVTLAGNAEMDFANTPIAATWSGFGGSITGGVNNLTGVYTPSAAEINNGFVDLTLSSGDPDGTGPCPIGTNTVRHNITLKPTIAAFTAGLEYCASVDSVLFQATNSNAAVNAVTWTESNVGTLSSASGYTTYYRFNPVEMNTTSDVLVSATVTTNANGVCTAAQSTANFTIKPKAIVSAGNDAEVCQQKPSSVVNLTGSRSNAASSSTWSTTDGGGNFTNATAAITTYNAVPADYDQVLKFFILSNDPVGPCPAVMDSVLVTIHSLPVPYILNTDTVLCRNEQSLTLIGNFGSNASTRTFTSLAGVSFTGGQYKLNPGAGAGGTGVGNHTITYHVTDANNCTDSTKKIFKVYPIPQVNFTTSSNCEGDVVTLSDISTVPSFPAQFPGGSTVVARKWKIGGLDKDTTITLNNTFIPYGDFTITLIDTSTTEGDVENKCYNSKDSIIHIAPYPSAQFTWTRACAGDTTFYTNQTTIPANGVSYFSTYDWDMVGAGTYHLGTSSTSTNPRYEYSAPGTYNVELIATTQRIVYLNGDAIPDDTVTFAGCKDTALVEVYNLPMVTPTVTSPYKTSFETSDMGWAPSGQNYSWKWTNPTDKDSMALVRNAWVTSDSIYNIGEKSFLNSPCFDFSGLNKPMILLKMWSATTAQLAGSILQVSTNNGNTWQMVGNIGDGQEWYNTQGVVGLIGTPGNNLAVGWSGQSHDWMDSRIGLSSLAGNTRVRMRVAFSATNEAEGRSEGIAIDSVWIGNRSKVVLMEHFTNVTSAASNTANTAIDNIRAARPLDVAMVAFHTSFPGADPYASFNFSDPGARTLYYGVSSAPRTVMDGTYYNGSVYSGGTSAARIDVADVDARSLVTSQFEISMNSSFTPGQFNLGVRPKYFTSPLNQQLVLHVAVVEDSASGNNSMNAVLRKMVPDAAGTELTNWGADSTVSHYFSWAHTLPASAKLGVVAYIQNIITKEIYQASYLRGTATNGSQFVDGTLDAHFTQWNISMFPNPATESATVLFGGTTNQKLKWELMNTLGETVVDGVVNHGSDGFSVDTQQQVPGVYTLKISDENGASVTKKLMVVR